MKYKYIVLAGLLLPMAEYSKDPISSFESLGKALCLKAAEFQKLDEQIRTRCYSLWTDCQDQCKNELFHAIKQILKEKGIDIPLTDKHFIQYGLEVEVHLYKGYPNYYIIREEDQDTTQTNEHEECIKKVIHRLEDEMIALCNNFIASLYRDNSLDDDPTIAIVYRFTQFKPYALQLAYEIYALQHLVSRYHTELNEFFAVIKELLPCIFYTEQVESNSEKKISSGIPLSLQLGLIAGVGLALCGIMWQI